MAQNPINQEGLGPAMAPTLQPAAITRLYGYRLGYKAQSRAISGVKRALRKYMFGREAPKLLPTQDLHNPTYNLTEGLSTRLMTGLQPRKCSGPLRNPIDSHR